MGILNYYLVNKLKTIKESIRNALIDKGVEVDDNDTFESYAEKIKDIQSSSSILYRIIGLIPDNLPKGYSDELGILSTTDKYSYCIAPKYTTNNEISLNPYTLTPQYTSAGFIMGETYYVDLRNITAKAVILPRGFNYCNYVRTLILPNKVKLNTCVIYGTNVVSSTGIYSSNSDTSYLLTRGLIFTGSVSSCHSSWIYPSRTSNKDVHRVYVAPGFTGTVYLTKLNMSVDTMIGIFENLADLTTTGKSYTLNLGSSNLEKLTQEQQEIATIKGWELV